MWLHNERLRLYGIDAPELTGPTKVAGEASKHALTEKIDGKRVHICTITDRSGADDQDKYGRYLARIWLDDENINEWLVENGFATERRY